MPKQQDIDVLKELHPEYNSVLIKIALSKAIKDSGEGSFIEKARRHLLKFRPPNKEKQKINKPIVLPTKQKRGRKPLHKGKKVLGGTKKTVRDFWLDYDNAMDLALNDNFPDTPQPKGNYAKTKHFLRTHWKHVQYFRLVDLRRTLADKYPEMAQHSGFRTRRWGNAYYWENTGEIAEKPLWKKIDKHKLLNIFYIPEP